MIDKILVPLDGSDTAFKALTLACELADKHNTELLLLHVVPSHELPDSVRRFAEIERIDGPPELVYTKIVAKNVLIEGTEQAQSKGVQSIQQYVEYGDPAKTIVELANRENVNMIVMGTRGVSDITGLVFGSVAHKVNHLASCTVASIK